MTGRMGSLVVVGTGIKAIAQVTREAQYHLETADKLLYVLADPVTARWVSELNPSAESLHHLYQVGQPRSETYTAMVERVLAWVRRDVAVCLALYGHAGAFAAPGHEAVRRARAEGYRAEMLPAVSAEDCLYADLGIDPGLTGCQSYEATDFLLHPKRFDASVPLILWQVGLIGDLDFRQEYECWGLEVLVDHLQRFYSGDHPVWIYEAAQFPISRFRLTSTPLSELARAEVFPISTLYVPPLRATKPSTSMYERLRLGR
jgi:hypothetical protein